MSNDVVVQADMALNEYAKLASETAIYPGRGTAIGLIYCALKLNGEAGELAEHVGKALRDDSLLEIEETPENTLPIYPAILKHDRLLLIRKEVGDCLWYLSQLCHELSKQFGAEITLGEIAMENILKLQSRKKRNQLQGSGDNR